MLRSIFTWIRRKEPEPIEGSNIYETIINQLGDIDELTKKTFLAPKTRTVFLVTASSNLGELADYLVEASVFVSKQQYMPERWKLKRVVAARRTLEEYIADDDELLHPLDWVGNHRHYIIKLVDAFLTMDSADREYYQRKCNFVIEDVLALIKASRECVR